MSNYLSLCPSQNLSIFMKISSLYFSVCCLFFISCKEQKVKSAYQPEPANVITDSNHPSFVTDMELAHRKDELYKNEMVCFNLDMTFGNHNSLMKIFTTPNSSAIRLDKQNGISTILIDGKTYTNADKADWESEKAGIFTYHYFFMLPYKFSDPGTVWEQKPPMEINGDILNRAKLTFQQNIGDSPNDWYMVHSDSKTNLVEHIGYIVTGGGTSIEEAEKHAHAISYLDYKQVGRVPMATKWLFSDYDKEKGLGKQIGEGILRNIDFMNMDHHFDVAYSDEYSLIE